MERTEHGSTVDPESEKPTLECYQGMDPEQVVYESMENDECVHSQLKKRRLKEPQYDDV
jgi:hypothetical protein